MNATLLWETEPCSALHICFTPNVLKYLCLCHGNNAGPPFHAGRAFSQYHCTENKLMQRWIHIEFRGTQEIHLRFWLTIFFPQTKKSM